MQLLLWLRSAQISFKGDDYVVNMPAILERFCMCLKIALWPYETYVQGTLCL